MAGRKRKVQDLAVATAAVTHKESDLVLLRTKSERNRRASAKVTSQSVPCESVQRFEPERSHYFNGEPRRRLEQDFYSQPCISLAKAFLGKVLVRRCADGSELRGRIVETEAYLGGEDKASHSAGGKRTERNTAMFMKPGEGAAVLLRSLEPLQGQSAMRKLRAARRQEGARQLKDKELCNGPSKLCQALNIPRCFDRRDLASDPEVWLEADESPPKPQDIVSAPRIGIESHGEWAKKPWRFYLRGHPCVSVVNKEAERRSLSVNAADSSDP
ncbi:DNA-3-methyladenine glycosylase-like isoform X2 [Girardinichthys multiradiatus]|uniref:DNA-3-methyladenine glycosylase-like isoform X2 n=1 Tax=Girardinichthys multiradiatus TaxID=208333 RepID=UPI001FAD9648|nr:DNA-3-methyladenine glycosylase-like isoform X2 [Girardinichthys multiradiatus]